MPGSTARMVLKQPFMLSSTIWSNSSGVVSQPVLPIGPEPPATLTRISTPSPKAAASLTMRSQSAAWVTSHFTTITLTPMARASKATGSIAARSRPASARCTPSRAKARLIAAPMPLAGPVTIATLLLSCRSMGVLFSGDHEFA